MNFLDNFFHHYKITASRLIITFYHNRPPYAPIFSLRAGGDEYVVHTTSLFRSILSLSRQSRSPMGLHEPQGEGRY